jgi:L-iditol 2-dehydrogenase
MAAPPWKTGALQKYISHPAAFSFKLPENVSTIEGAMVEPLSVGFYAATKSGAEPGKHVLILGSGCIGLMTLLACKARGVTDITVVDILDNRLEKAAEIGASRVINSKDINLVEVAKDITGGRGYDIVFEAAGFAATTEMTPYLASFGGKVCIIGSAHDKVLYDFVTLCCKEVDIISIFRYRNLYPLIIESIASGSLPVSKIASDFFSFDDVNEAFSYAVNQKQTAIKVVVKF